jgi:hypothetical protein
LNFFRFKAEAGEIVMSKFAEVFEAATLLTLHVKGRIGR